MSIVVFIDTIIDDCSLALASPFAAASDKGHTAKNCGGTAFSTSSTSASSNMGGEQEGAGRARVDPADEDDEFSSSISISPAATAAAAEVRFLLVDGDCGKEELLEEEDADNADVLDDEVFENEARKLVERFASELVEAMRMDGNMGETDDDDDEEDDAEDAAEFGERAFAAEREAALCI